MSDSKHTDGPWWPHSDQSDAGYEVWSANFQICATYDVCEDLTRKQQRANAHLIAAAPELLEACEDALYIGREKLTIERIQEKLRAAITKAKGGSNE